MLNLCIKQVMASLQSMPKVFFEVLSQYYKVSSITFELHCCGETARPLFSTFSLLFTVILSVILSV